MYTQVSKQDTSISKVIKIKDTFPALNTKKIDQIHNIINSSPKTKSCIQMITKELSRKQIIIPMDSDNITKFMKNSSLYIANINQLLRNLKLEVLVNFIYSDLIGVTVVINKVAVQLDLYIIENYIKNVDDIDSLDMEVLRLPKSKFYLKIIGITYFPHDKSQKYLSSSDVEHIIKQNQIFDNIVLALKPQVIKVFLKLDMSIVWIDIWDIQSGNKAKSLINQCFNVEKYIITIKGANMNPGVLQCKNYWKWEHATISYRIQGLKYIKCNRPHKSENLCGAVKPMKK